MAAFLAFMIMGICWGLPQLGWPPLVLVWIPAGYFFVRGTRQHRLAALLGLCAGLAATAWEEAQKAEWAAVETPAGTVWVEGVVADRDDRPEDILLLLDETRLDQHPSPGLIRLVFKKSKVTALPGERVKVQATFREYSRKVSPGAFDMDRYFLQQGIALHGRGEGETVAGLQDTGDWRWNRLRWQIAQQVGEVVSSERRGLTEVMLVGKRNWLSRDVREELQASGIYHLISISGLHMALVAGGSFFLFRLLLVFFIPLSRHYDLKPWSALLSLPPLIFYALLSGLSVPTLRSLIMTMVFLGSLMLGRPVNSWRSWMAAAILLLLWHPSQLLDAGFQLSFVAVATLLAVGRELRRLQVTSTLWQGFWQTLMVGVILTPLVSYHFHFVSWYGFFANLATVTWSSVTTIPLGFFALLARFAWPEAFNPLVFAMSYSLDPLRWVGEWNALLPGGWWRTPGPAAFWLLLAVALLPLTAILPAGNKRLLATGLILLLPCIPRSTPYENHMLFAVLDVGQAQAALLRDAGGGWHLVDAGGIITNRYHVAEGVISPFLWWANADRLERIIISHPQMDHYAGVARMLDNFPTRELWIGHFPREESRSPTYGFLLKLAQKRQTDLVRVAAGHEAVAHGLSIKIIHPEVNHTGGSTNNNSLVVLATYGKHGFLLPGDVERPGIKRLLKANPKLTAQVVIAPHHGSGGSRHMGFTNQLKAQHVIFSLGQYNRYGFPRHEVVHDWLKSGALLWQTSLDGTILFKSDGQNVEQVSFQDTWF
ncbi:MAG: DNA internalization-related competence protein ComEC/Rec2 [Magnetococcales bacterium]|nr:DNA internalization-related competence protein ComEC/Rec2 [Magnetococcales bacterium]